MAVDDALEITVLQLPKFKAEATKLIGEDGIDALAVYLIDHPAGGDVIPGTGGARKLRWATKEGFAANRGQSERSAIECPRKRLRRRQPLERT